MIHNFTYFLVHLLHQSSSVSLVDILKFDFFLLVLN